MRDPRAFEFTSSFSLGASRSRVHDVLLDLEHYSDWWPQVRAVGKLDDDHALVVCRSSLPYDLELVLTAVDRSADRLEVAIDGPIRGWARFRLDEQGPDRTSVLFEQQVRAEAPVFVVSSYVVRPLLAWNHHRMMAGCADGLQRQLSEATAAS